MLELRSECHTVWCWVQLPGHSSIPVDAAEGTMQHSTLGTDTNGWMQMTRRCHPTSMRCAPSAQSVRQLLTAVDSLKSQLHPLLPRSTYWPHHHLWWAEWDRSKLLSTWMLVCLILNAEKKKKARESKEVYFTHCWVIVRTKQRKTALIWSTRGKMKRNSQKPQTSSQHFPQPAQSAKSKSTATSLQVQLYKIRVLTGLPLCTAGREKARTQLSVGGVGGGGGGGAGRDKDPHLAVFASAKQKSHLHSWCMHEETSSLTLSHTHAPVLIMSYQHNQHYVQENDKFSISGSVDTQKKVRNGWWWR